MPTRRIDIPGAFNVRDLGGLPTTDGKMTRTGRFVRSDLLSGLPDSAKDALVAIGARTVVDLRTTEERMQHPCSVANDVRVDYRHVNLLGDEPIPGFVLSLDSQTLAHSYAVILAARDSAIRDVFATLARETQSATVFFCAGGTDRTGLIAALLLGLAGVPDETITEDYSLSAQGLVDRFLAHGAPRWIQNRNLTSGRALGTLARRDTMLELLRRLRRGYGSATSYLRSIGVTDEEINEIRRSFIE